MIGGVIRNDIKTYVQQCKNKQEDFFNNVCNIEGKIQELNKKFEELQKNKVEDKTYVKAAELNEILAEVIEEIKLSFDYLLSSTPRELSEVKNEINELKKRLESLEPQKVEIENVETNTKKAVPKMLLNCKKKNNLP